MILAIPDPGRMAAAAKAHADFPTEHAVVRTGMASDLTGTDCWASTNAKPDIFRVGS